ncbi:DUF3120 domain-containing protein [Cyanobium sp. HWJ4-Hawea]|nr:DUF3120 domain-containing protein [Cyanobium sp. HWJ4-Hawea]
MVIGAPRSTSWALEAASGVLVTLPVFLQAPWVRIAPFSATLFTVPLVAIGLALAHHPNPRMRDWGYLLVGFCGSWLGGCLFWGWCRLHPIWHLPLEAFVLPLALAGLGGRWRLACGFYLGSLIGTAATDGAIALTGVMPLWPQVLGASPSEAASFLQAAALQLLQPTGLLVVGAFALGLSQLCRWLGGLGEVGRITAAALATTLAVDGLFWLVALAAPKLSGLI